MYFVEIVGFALFAYLTFVFVMFFIGFQTKKSVCENQTNPYHASADATHAIYKVGIITIGIFLVGLLFHRYYFGQKLTLRRE